MGSGYINSAVLLKYFQAFIVYSFLQETAAHEIDFIRLSVRSQPGMEAAVVVASASADDRMASSRWAKLGCG